MTCEVFKVVKNKASEEAFCSNMIRGTASFVYRLGQEIKSDTPIFVFDDWLIAKTYAINHTILVGTTTTEPIVPMLRLALNVDDYVWDKDVVHSFWERYKRNPASIQGNYPLSKLIPGTRFVYDFTPLGVMERK